MRDMKKIEGKIPIFVIGYPKSGNTWITRLIGDALNSRTGSGYLRHSTEIASEGADRTGNYFVLKSHHSKYDRPSYILMPDKKSSNEPIIFYVVRNFRDVLISSFFHFHRNFNKQAILLNEDSTEKLSLKRIYFNDQIKRMTKKWCGPRSLMLNNYVNMLKTRIIVKLKGEKTFTPVVVGNWSEHVLYWTSLYRKLTVIKYEDMQHNPYGVLRNCFLKLDMEFDSKRVIEAIKRQSFKERKKNFEIQNDIRNANFLRKGVSGDWKNYFTAKQEDFVIKKHGKVMKEMGYV